MFAGENTIYYFSRSVGLLEHFTTRSNRSVYIKDEIILPTKQTLSVQGLTIAV